MFSIKEIRQPFLLDDKNEINLIERFDNEKGAFNIFELTKPQDINVFSSNLFLLIRNNNSVKYSLGVDHYFIINKNDKIFDIYTKIINYKKMELILIGDLEERKLANDLLNLIEDSLSREITKRSSDEIKEFFYQFVAENSREKISGLDKNHVFFYLMKHQISGYNDLFKNIFKSTDIQTLLTGESSYSIKDNYDLNYIEKLESYASVSKEPNSYYTKSFDYSAYDAISKVVLMKLFFDKNYIDAKKLINSWPINHGNIDIPFIILKELSDTQLSLISGEFRSIIDLKIIDLEIMRRKLEPRLLMKINVNMLRSFLIKISVWPTNFEVEMKEILEKMIDDHLDNGIIQNIIDLSRDLDSRFPHEEMRLIYLIKDKINEFNKKYFQREISFDYFKLNYIYHNNQIFEHVLASSDINFLYNSEFFSEVNKIKIMLNVLFRKNKKIDPEIFSDELLIEIFKYGIGSIIGPAIASEKRRFIRMFSSLLHEISSIKVSDRIIRLFFTKLSNSKIRKTVLEKMFGMPEIIDGNSFLRSRDRHREYSVLDQAIFLGREYSELLPIIDDLDIQNGIKSTILLLALQ